MNNGNDDCERGCPITPITTKDAAADVNIFVPEAQDSKALKSLLNFCVNNKALDELESLISKFNPLKVLGVSEFEIRHSNVLAWLISPTAHHGLGDTLFKKFLLEILKDNRDETLPKIEDVLGADYSDLKILREWRCIDLFILSPSNKLAVVIENKINATESANQLAKYAEIVSKKYPEYKKAYIFLTLDGIAPNGSERYIPFKHEQIHDIVKSVVEIRRDYMHAKVYDFIEQYLQVLEEKTMQNQEFIAICSKLYMEHREAIALILRHGKPKLEPSHIRDFHKRTDTESIFANKDSVNLYYHFIPCKWSGIVPTTSKYSDKYLVSFQFNFTSYEDNKINMYLYVSNFPDAEERIRFVTLLAEAAKSVKNSKLNIRTTSRVVTTIFSKKISLKDEKGGDYALDEYDTVTDKLVEIYNSREVRQVIDIVGGVVKKFWGKDGESL